MRAVTPQPAKGDWMQPPPFTLDYQPSETEAVKVRRKLRASIAWNLVGVVFFCCVLALSRAGAYGVPRGWFCWVIDASLVVECALKLRKGARALQALGQPPDR